MNFKPQKRSSQTRAEIVAFIAHYQAEWQYPPTFEEVRTGCHLSSKSLVNFHLQVLAATGKVTWKPHQARTLRVIGNEQSDYFYSFRLSIDSAWLQAV